MLKKLVGYVLLELRITKDGTGIVWTDDDAIVGNGSLGACRLWRGKALNAPLPYFWQPPKSDYTADDYDTLVESGYKHVYVNTTTGDYYTPTEHPMLNPQVITQPVAPQPSVTTQPPVMTPQ
tara:strand:- start:42 stop:407 length:366 start_codon:yes stop_codon:yes gene_type:complete